MGKSDCYGKKPSGDYRLCADFVALNKILKVTRYAIPNINNFSAMAHGCSWFSSIDIKDAYYHIPVRPADSHKLTITTPIGNFRYLFLPMGLFRILLEPGPRFEPSLVCN